MYIIRSWSEHFRISISVETYALTALDCNVECSVVSAGEVSTKHQHFAVVSAQGRRRDVGDYRRS